MASGFVRATGRTYDRTVLRFRKQKSPLAKRAVPHMRGGGSGPPLNLTVGQVIGGCEAGRVDHAEGTCPARD